MKNFFFKLSTFSFLILNIIIAFGYADEYYNSPLELVGIDYWHNHNILGSSINIAVIDEDFDDNRVKSLPYVIKHQKYGTFTDSDDSHHGDQCVEIIHQVAPEARLYLYEIKSDKQIEFSWPVIKDSLVAILQDILKTLTDGDDTNDIKIVSMSLGYYPDEFVPYYNPSNGISEIASLIRTLRNRGVIFVKSAGNNADKHFGSKGRFKDSNDDKIFDDDINIFMDADTYLYFYFENSNKSDYQISIDSDSWQSAEHKIKVTYNNQNNQQEKHLIKIKYVGNDPNYKSQGFEIFGRSDNGMIISPRVPESSLLFPAGVKEVITVGAVKFENDIQDKAQLYETNYSSNGPALGYNGEKIIKPDFVAPDQYSYSQDSFFSNNDTWVGTSFSAPLVAGGLALLLEAYSSEILDPVYCTEHAINILKGNAVDLYPFGDLIGKDNFTGFGLVQFQDDACEFLKDGTRNNQIDNACSLDNDIQYDLMGFDYDYFKINVEGLVSVKLSFVKNKLEEDENNPGDMSVAIYDSHFRPVDFDIQTYTSENYNLVKVTKQLRFTSPENARYYIAVAPQPTILKAYKYSLKIHEGTIIDFTSPKNGEAFKQGDLLRITASVSGYKGQTYDLGLYKGKTLIETISNNVLIQDGKINISWTIPVFLEDSSEYRLGLIDINSGQMIFSNYFTIAHSSPILLSIKFTGDGKGTVYINSEKKCTEDCILSFEEPTQITLRADPEGNYHFQKWSGIEECKNENPCIFMLNKNKDVYAYFQENFHFCYDFEADEESMENTPFDSTKSGPYCANSWIINDIDNDGYQERYLLTGSTYLAWTSAKVWKWDGGSAIINSIKVYGKEQDCYDGACDEYFERYLYKRTYNSPTDKITFPFIEWGAKLSGNSYGYYWNSFNLRHCWDENNNDVFCDDGDHIENYLIIDCGVDEDCGPGKQCVKPVLNKPTEFYCAPKEYYLTIEAGNGGTIRLPGIGKQGPYQYGDEIRVIAIPASGYHFYKWSGTAVEKGAISNIYSENTSAIIHGDYTLKAEFKKNLSPPKINSFTSSVSEGIAPLKVYFECSAYDPDGGTITYFWDFDGDGDFDANSTSGSFDYTFKQKGEYNVKCQVVDDEGTKTSQNLQIIVKSLQVDINADPIFGIAPLKVLFNCKIHDPLNFNNSHYKWDFDGDGNIDLTTSSNKIEFTYHENGKYNATCSIEDVSGSTLTSTPIVISVEKSVSDGNAWSDDFDSYLAGELPASWIPSGNGGKIISTGKGMSLGLSGVAGGCWEGLAYHELGVANNAFTVEFDILVNKVEDGCHTYSADIVFKDGPQWFDHTVGIFIGFRRDDHKIIAVAKSKNNEVLTLGTWEEHKWYHIALNYWIIDSQKSANIFIDGKLVGSIDGLELGDHEQDLSYIGFGGGDGEAWIDNVKVSKYQPSQNGSNLIINGSFDSDLSPWIFKDQSSPTSYCSDPNAKGYVENGQAVIHTHLMYAEGTLTQTLSEPVKPKKLGADYSEYSPVGNCHATKVSFLNKSGDVLASFLYHKDSSLSRASHVFVTLLGENKEIPFDEKYSAGRIEFIFEWEKKVVEARWLSHDKKETVVLDRKPLNNDEFVSTVELFDQNSCCDGRDDGYSYFDNIVVEKSTNTQVSCGDVWIEPSKLEITTNKDFEINIHLNSGSNKIGSYQFKISYDPSFLQLNGIDPGPDSLSGNNYNIDYSNNTITVAGFDAQGAGPGVDLNILSLHFSSLENIGSSNLDFYVLTLTNDFGNNLGAPFAGCGSLITITKKQKIGDVSGDGSVDIIDALFIARMAVGLTIDGNYDESAADVNCDGQVNIVDALFIARKAVGLPVSGWCGE